MSSFNQTFPQTRMRRMRHDAFSRNLMREHTLTAHDLIYPVFVTEGERLRTPIPSMPNQFRLSLDELLRVAERAVTLDIPALALFPVVEAHKKTLDGREAFNPDGLVPRVARSKKNFRSWASSPMARWIPIPRTVKMV